MGGCVEEVLATTLNCIPSLAAGRDVFDSGRSSGPEDAGQQTRRLAADLTFLRQRQGPQAQKASGCMTLCRPPDPGSFSVRRDWLVLFARGLLVFKHLCKSYCAKSNGDGSSDNGGRPEKLEATSWAPARLAARDVMAAQRLT
ncbi:hypothetical protein Bbelb_050010 [Branchiostoma belcheri]|nr:hypothetical protein Bbelb_050010 [Branchiostoma belcheri]